MSKLNFRSAAAVALIAIAAILVPPNGFAAIIGTTEVPLNGLRNDVRSVETNLGNLVADAFFWQASQSGFSPTIAIVNGGAIRNNSIAFPGATAASPADIDDTFPQTVLPFTDDVVVIAAVPVTTLLGVLENSVFQAAPGEFLTTGRFLQLSGLMITWDRTASPGSRIVDASLDDGTLLIDDGTVVSTMLLNIAAPDFIASGGDQYSMFPGGFTVTTTGVLEADALSNFIQNSSSGLSGIVSETDYPPGGESRIERIPAPAMLALLGIGLAGLGLSRRRMQ